MLIEALGRLERRSAAVMEQLRADMFAPNRTKVLDISFTISKAAKMVGRTSETIRQAESEGRLPAPRLSDQGRRLGYSLEEVNHMRDVLGTRIRRAPDDPPVIIAVQNFKGGVGKSTLTTHLGQYLALQGLRVLIVDCDSQASTTSMFGFNPDLDVTDESTLLPFFIHGAAVDLRYAVRPTNWPGIDLIAANLALYQAEYEAAAKLRGGNADALDRLRIGVEAIAEDYDVVLLGPPPARGMISLGVLRAANALLIPTPPSTVDFASTTHFLRMILETLEVLHSHGLSERGYHFLRVVATKVDEGKSAHSAIRDSMERLFGADMLRNALLDSAEIDTANVHLRTVYELSDTTTQTHKRCRNNLDLLNAEIETLIRRVWPSHRESLRKQGLI